MRISLRWKLIFLSWTLAFAAALALGVPLYVRSERQLVQQLEKTLETKCDEVITLLETAPMHPVLDDFFRIETTFRFSPYTYFYQIRDAQGRTLARSQTLGKSELPTPDAWKRGDLGSPILFETGPSPVAPGGERVRLRSEHVKVAAAGNEPTALMIQVAVSLGPFKAAMRRTLRDALLIEASGLVPVFFLLWFVTTRSLRPVSEMTKKAAQITATNLSQRLPVSSRDDELDQLAKVLNDMLDRLGGSLRQMELFSSGAAHQLRTPLTRIRGELDLILRSGVADPPRSQLERIQEELEGLTRLCGRLLLLGRLDQRAGDAGLFDERVDLEQVVLELLDQMSPVAADRGVGLRCGAISKLHVRGSRPLLVEALLNLLDNAIRSTPEGGSIAVSVEARGHAVRVSVEDNGPGVPPPERERIFQPFYGIHKPSAGEADGRSGLGLAIVRGITQSHGGHVELADAPTGGSVFSLVLPAHPGS